jgi:hypothetical protein
LVRRPQEEPRSGARVWTKKAKVTRAMPDQHDLDRRNDARFVMPLLIMALIIVAGMLLYAYTGHALAAPG